MLAELAATPIDGGVSAEASASYAEQAEAEARDEAYYDAMDWAEADALEAENEVYAEYGDLEYADEYGR